MNKKKYIQPQAEIVRLNLKGRVLYEADQNYNGGGMTMITDSKGKQVSSGNVKTAQENTEEDEVGAKGFHPWGNNSYNLWDDE